MGRGCAGQASLGTPALPGVAAGAGILLANLSHGPKVGHVWLLGGSLEERDLDALVRELRARMPHPHPTAGTQSSRAARAVTILRRAGTILRRAGTSLRRAVTMLPRGVKTARQHWRPLAGAALAMVLIVSAVVGAKHPADVKGAVASATLALRQTAAAVSSAAAAAIAVQPPPVEPVQADAKAVGSPRVRARRNPPIVRSLTAHDLVESKDVTVHAAAVERVQPVVQMVVPSTDAVVDAAERTELSEALIYSEQDTNVRAPQLLSAGFPGPSIFGSGTLTNRMELIVSADGSVERVKLLTSPRRMSDIMLLTSVKAWRFSPAVQDDRPVRYRLALSWDVNP